jgi:hypothetical protein
MAHLTKNTEVFCRTRFSVKCDGFANHTTYTLTPQSNKLAETTYSVTPDPILNLVTEY